MPKTKISEYSTTNSQNTDIQSINIDEGCAPSGINNAIRELMVHLRNFQTNASGDGATLASLVVQGTGSFTGGVTLSGGATLSGTNTLSGSNIMSGNINSSGTNTFSGSQVISGNINSSGTTNTFSGGNILSGTNTLSGATIISGNFNATGTTNTFSNALILGNNLTFTGTGNRITGDFSNATVANRVAFQTSTANSNTAIGVIPNGTGTSGQINLFSSSDPANSSVLSILNASNLAESRFQSGLTGTGTYLPMTFYTGGSERMRIDTSGNVGIGTSTSTVRLSLGTNTPAGTASKLRLFDDGAAETSTTSNSYGFGISAAGQFSYTAGTSGLHAWFTANTERMRIDSSGNVGIGTSSPGNKLDILGGNLSVSKTSGIPVLIIQSSQASGYAPSQLQLFRTGASQTATPDNSLIGEIRFDGLSTGGVYDNMATIAVTMGANASGGAASFMTFATASSGANATERMRIDSSGNVGIGTSSPAALLSFGSLASGSSDGARIYLRNNTNEFAIGTNGSQTVYAGFQGHVWQTGSFGGTERMRIDSSGNVGINTTSPASKLDISTGGSTGTTDMITLSGLDSGSAKQTYGVIRMGIENSTAGSEQGNLHLQTVESGTVRDRIYMKGGGEIGFYNGGTERARITSGGEFYVAGTTDQGAYNIQCNGTGVWGAGAYVNGSDARIKEDVAPIDSGLDVVEKLNPVTYRYKEDWSKDQSVQTGFIAQELLTALDGKNYVDGIVQQGGAEGYYSVAYQNIIPILTKAIQELKSELDAAKARIAVLESN